MSDSPLRHPTEKTVYLIRHGQSIDNASPVFQSVNSPLSEKGRQQAQSVAERMMHVPFETLVASPVLRAKETAGFITAKTGKEPLFSDLFVERVKPSDTDGKPWTDKTASQIWRDWEESLYTPGMRISDGENYDDVVARTDKALAFLVNRPEQSLAVVTHGHFLRAVVARVLLDSDLTGDILKRFQTVSSTENTGITVLQYRKAFEGEFAWRLWTFNDHSHVTEIA